jgi:hypothetical protein
LETLITPLFDPGITITTKLVLVLEILIAATPPILNFKDAAGLSWNDAPRFR